jgi:succinyl-CoA synthetase beta subunit
MNLRGYQSKLLFARNAIPILKGGLAGSPKEAVSAVQKLGVPNGGRF